MLLVFTAGIIYVARQPQRARGQEATA